MPIYNFWVGDYDFAYDTYYGNNYYLHWAFYGQPYSTPQDLVWDTIIYSTIGAWGSFNYFDFIWTCSNGGSYWTPGGWGNPNLQPGPPLPPNYDPYTVYGGFDPKGYEVGMPFAWTGTLSMSPDGYDSPGSWPYCYIGFQGPSPGLSTYAAFSETTYQTFVQSFYNAFTGQVDGNHWNVIDSLNYAAQQTWGPYQNYLSCPLFNGWDSDIGGQAFYSRMEVLGDGLYYMDYDGPSS